MDMVNIILIIVLAAVAVLLAFSVIHLAQSRRHEERGLISRRLRLSHLLGSPFI